MREKSVRNSPADTKGRGGRGGAPSTPGETPLQPGRDSQSSPLHLLLSPYSSLKWLVDILHTTARMCTSNCTIRKQESQKRAEKALSVSCR